MPSWFQLYFTPSPPTRAGGDAPFNGSAMLRYLSIETPHSYFFEATHTTHGITKVRHCHAVAYLRRAFDGFTHACREFRFKTTHLLVISHCRRRLATAVPLFLKARYDDGVNRVMFKSHDYFCYVVILNEYHYHFSGLLFSFIY